MTSSQPEPRLHPASDTPLMSRIEPLPWELFRSFLARTASEAEIPYYTFLERLGIPATTSTPAWVGVDLSNDEAELIAPILRHDAETLRALQLRTTSTDHSNETKHPTRYRACPECQTEHGAWMRWNVDPLHIVCPFHRTLLHSEGPEGQQLRNDRPFTQAIDWSDVAQSSSEDLDEFGDLQELLRHHRVESPEIDAMFERVLIAYLGAVEAAPESAQLVFITNKGRAALDHLNRSDDRTDIRRRVAATKSIWASVEDTAAVFPTAAAFILEAVVSGNPSGYHELLNDLNDLSPQQPNAPKSSRLPGPSTLYELDKHYEKWLNAARSHRAKSMMALLTQGA